MQKTVSLHTLGCKLNYSETSTIAGKFHKNGYNIMEYGEKSDVFVLNTCSVTDNADKECRQIIRSVLNKNPETYIIITGCYAQLQPHEIAAIHGVDLVLGAKEKFNLFKYIENLEKKNISCVFTSPIDEVTDFEYAYSSDIDSRTRAFLKIQDGCDFNCSFCTIPLARGASRSLSIDKVIDNAKKLLDSGYKEIVLTGVNTGDYNYQTTTDTNLLKYRLIDVLFRLDKLHIPRIRISSIEPNLLNDEIIQLVKSSKNFCRHFHIPLQSGDKDILKIMRRRYNTGYYEGLIYKIKEEISDAGIGAVVIVGFPGETGENFENTFNFLEELPLSYLHVFSYSERKDTHAVTLPGSVDIAERKKRSSILRKLSDKKRGIFYEKNINKIHNVLFETVKKDNTIYGFTDNYIKVKSGAGKNLETKIFSVRLSEAISHNYCEGKLIFN